MWNLASLCRVALMTPFLALMPGLADAGNGIPKNVVSASILDGWVTPSGTRMSALKLTLAPGWKTYWRAPGDAGIPPSFSWAGSRNLKDVSYHWPSPQVFDNFGMQSIGYKHELVLPLELTPASPGKPIELRGNIDLGVCDSICMPAHLTISAKLSGRGAPDPEITAALKDQPLSGDQAGVKSAICRITPISDGIRLSAEITMPALKGHEAAMVESGDPHIWVSDPKISRHGGTLRVTADLVPPNDKPILVDRSHLRFTVIGDDEAVDIRGCSAG